MGDLDHFKVFAIIWVGCVPIAVSLIIFTFCLITSNSNFRARDAIVCSLLLSRLGHCAGVVIMICLFVLYNWHWTELLCEVLLWMWIAYFMADIFTTLSSTGYHASKIGRSSNYTGCAVAVLLFLSWAAAIALGASPFLTTDLFYNYEVNDKNHTRKCFLGVNKNTNNSLHLGVNMFLVICILMSLMLVIALLAEGKVALKRIKSKTRSSLNHDGAKSTNLPRGFRKVSAHAEADEIRDIKYIHYAATYCTGLFNCAPQLAMYVTDMQLPYSHEILVSAGLIHAIILPILLCVMSIRYRRQASRLLCCKKSPLEPGHAHNNDMAIVQRDANKITSRVMVDRATSISIPGVTITESSDGQGADNLAFSEEGQAGHRTSNGHVVVVASVENDNRKVDDRTINDTQYNHSSDHLRIHQQPRRSNSACIDRRTAVNSLATVKRSSSGGSHTRNGDFIPEVDENQATSMSVIVEDCKQAKRKSRDSKYLPQQDSQETFNSDHTLNLVKSQKGSRDSYIASSFHPDHIEVCSNHSSKKSYCIVNDADARRDKTVYQDDPPPYDSINNDASIHLPDQNEDMSYYDSDSEAWSNLYAESDIADILDSQGNSPASARSDRLKVPEGHARKMSNGSSQRSASFSVPATATAAKQKKRQTKKGRKKPSSRRKEVGIMSGLASGAQFGLAVTMQIAKQSSPESKSNTDSNKQPDTNAEGDTPDSGTNEKSAAVLRDKPIRRESSKRVTVIRRVDSADKLKDQVKGHSRNSSQGSSSTLKSKSNSSTLEKINMHNRTIDSSGGVKKHGRKSSMGLIKQHSRQSSASGIITNGSLVRDPLTTKTSNNPFLTGNDLSYVPSPVNPDTFLAALKAPSVADSPDVSTNPFLSNDYAYHSTIGDMDQTANIYGTLGRREVARNDSLRARSSSNPFLHALDLQDQRSTQAGSDEARRRQAKARRAWRSAMMAISVVDFLKQKTESDAVLDTGDTVSSYKRQYTSNHV